MKVFDFRKNSGKMDEERYQTVMRRLEVLREHLTVHKVEIGRISPSPLFPAREEGLGDLAKSILRYGILEPLAVRRVSADDSSLGAVFQIVDGNRRLAAAKMLGIATLPCCVVDISANELQDARMSAVFETRSPDIFEKASAEAILRKDSGCFFKEDCISVEPTQNNLLNMSEQEWARCRAEQLDEETVCALAQIKDRNTRAQMLSEIVRIRRNFIKSAEMRAGKRSGMGKLLLCDIRPIYNSFERYVRFLRQSGIAACWRKEEGAECYRMVVEIPKRSYCGIGSESDPLPFDGYDLKDFAL